MKSDAQPGPVAVTGASGFIGRAVIGELLFRGIPAIAVSRRTVERRDGVDVRRVESYRDIGDLPAGAATIHLAGEANVPAANRRGAPHVEDERGLARAVCGHAPGRVVYASSAQVYGDADSWPHGPDETPAGGTPYAEGKLAAERVVLERGGAVARLSNVYGPGKGGTLIADTLAQIPGTGPLRILDANARRDFLWIADAARCLVDMALGEAGGIFNLASGRALPAAEVAALALRLAGEGERPLEAKRDGATPSVIALDITRTTETFGWKPEVTLERGLLLLLGENAALGEAE
jgi:UDP-glucose 4-epimerase